MNAKTILNELGEILTWAAIGVAGFYACTYIALPLLIYGVFVLLAPRERR